MFYLDELEGSQKGEKLILICGGTDSVKSLYSIPNLDQFQFAGCNQHAIIIPQLAWVYAHDERMVKFLVEEKIPFPIISHRTELLRKIDIQAGVSPYVKLTAPQALWTAGFLGYDEIHVVGADDYNHPNRDYWHQFHFGVDPVESKRGREHNQRPWKEILSKWSFTKNVKIHSGLQTLVEKYV